MDKDEYETALEPLQVELNNMARWLKHSGRRLLVILEGRDAAGKGGTINAIADKLNPRQCRIVALDKPNERESGQWYFQRHVTQLPSPGEIVLFDRSWYNRAGIERVMGFCSEEETERFLKQAPKLEKMLVDDGLLLFKYWLAVDQEEQERRFAERAADPLKRWKLTPIDLKARELYAEYGRARDRMLEATHTRHAPWTLVNYDDQRAGRIALIRHLLDHLPDTHMPEEPLQMMPLRGKPKKERFDKKPKPIN